MEEAQLINRDIKRLMNKLEAVSKDIQELKQTVKPITNDSHKPMCALLEALSMAQGEFDYASLNRVNTWFKSPYSDLQSVVQASRPALTKYGLSVTQHIDYDNEEGCYYCTTYLHHKDGAYLSNKVKIDPPKNDIQSLFSYTQYVKRLSYMSLVGVITGDDDDAEKSMSQQRKDLFKGLPLDKRYNRKNESLETITKEQYEELEYELSEGLEDIAEQLLESYHLENLKQLPKSRFLDVIKRIREIKQARFG